MSLTDILQGKVAETDFSVSFIQSCYGITDDGSGTVTYDDTAEDANSKGSIDEVKSLLKKSIYITAGVVGGIVLLQLVLVWAGCHLIDSDKFGKNKTEDEK